MMFKKISLLLLLAAGMAGVSFAEKNQQQETSDQQISDFSLVGYADKGKKSWELLGKSADIFTDVVKLKDITGNLYGDKENVKLTSDRGDFNKAQGKIHLEDNVVITTTSGAKLTTDTLDWDRKNQFVNTEDVVNIEREGMFTTAKGAAGSPNLKKVDLKKDVTVEIRPVDKNNKPDSTKEKIIITCDGPLEIDYEKNVAVFKNNVKVDRGDSQIYSDVMEIYFLKKEATQAKEEKQKSDAPGSEPFMSNTSIDKLVCWGNVKIVRGPNISYSDEAVYSAADKKITLSGRPKLILYSSEDLKNAPVGN